MYVFPMGCFIDDYGTVKIVNGVDVIYGVKSIQNNMI